MSEKITKSKHLLVKRLLSLLVGLLLFALVFHLANFSWEEVTGQILGARWHIMFGVAACTAVIYYVAAFRWKYIVGDLTGGMTKVPAGYFYHYIAMGSMSGLLVPQAVGDLSVRSLSLKLTNGVPLTRGAYSIVLDQLITVMTNSLFVLPAVAFLLKKLSMELSLFLALMMVGSFFVIFCRFNWFILSAIAHVYSWIISMVFRVPFLKRTRAQVTSNASDLSISSDTAVKVLVFGLIKYFLIVLRLYVVAVSLRLDISFWVLFLGCSLVLTLALISFIPANLGLSELGWYSVLSFAGIPDTDIVTFVVSERILFSLSIILVGGVTWLFYQFFSGHERDRLVEMSGRIK